MTEFVTALMTNLAVIHDTRRRTGHVLRRNDLRVDKILDLICIILPYVVTGDFTGRVVNFRDFDITQELAGEIAKHWTRFLSNPRRSCSRESRRCGFLGINERNGRATLVAKERAPLRHPLQHHSHPSSGRLRSRSRVGPVCLLFGRLQGP